MLEVFPPTVSLEQIIISSNVPMLQLRLITWKQQPVISSVDIHPINMDKYPSWQQYTKLIKQTTGIITKYSRKKTLQHIRNNYNWLLFIVASMLINVISSSLPSILAYLTRIVNVER